ncbi:MAG: sulfatase [Gemmatimonadaceae bacterium]|nr:sulfatase [Gemmatimonadaceae bacterium]
MSSRARHVLHTVAIAAAAGVGTGVVQALVGLWRQGIGHAFIWLSRDHVWMTPLGTMLVFMAGALPVLLVEAVLPRRDARLAAFVFGTAAVFSLALLIPGLHQLAGLLVAMGAGARAAAWIGRDPARRRSTVYRSAAVLGACAIAVAAWRDVSAHRSERRQVASLPAAAEGAPNVLVIILDTVRAASMSFLGYPRPTTPALAALGAQGAVFEQAWSTAPWTLPSHAGMFTGRYPSQLSTDWRTPLDATPPTLAEALALRGYRTAGFAANHFYVSDEGGLSRGFEHWEDYKRTFKQVLLSATLLQTGVLRQLIDASSLGGRLRALTLLVPRTQVMWSSDRALAPDVTQGFLRWQAGIGNQPFLAFLNLYDAHLPYDPPGSWGTRFSPQGTELDRYDGGIAYMDSTLGAMFDELRQRGVLDRTLVIVSSDHGELFGEHGLHGHGVSLYRPELHVPLVVRYPARVPAGQRITAAVTLRDLPATVLDVVGAPQGFHGIPGTSWLPPTPGGAWPAGSAVVSQVSQGINTAPNEPVTRGPMSSLVTDSLHYIKNGDGREEVYAWRTDGGESRDVAAASPLDRLRAAIAAAVR